MKAFCLVPLVVLVVAVSQAQEKTAADQVSPSVTGSKAGASPVVVLCGDDRLHAAGLDPRWRCLKYEMFNVSRYGTSSRGGMKRLEIINRLLPDVVVYAYGLHDRDLPEFKKNMARMVYVQQAQRRRVVVLGITRRDGPTEQDRALNEWMEGEFGGDFLMPKLYPALHYADALTLNEVGMQSLADQMEKHIDALR
ncbi:MAG: hypothetical protein JXA20_01455 [Spirochaetes bacterium]|nr:hypothetical protein [Spirochaetota bacterium]